MSQSDITSEATADQWIAPGALPSLQVLDLPEPVSLRRMMGPSIILAGLALGSGELVIWPYITYKSQFVFFWAAILGVATQYFINMEITRWTLATGESAITGFCRLNRHWAWVFLLANIIPWMVPAWAKGAAQLVSWLVWGAELNAAGQLHSPYVTELAIGGMFLCGLLLTAGPVIYETVERFQGVLVGAILVIVAILAIFLIRSDAIVAQLAATVTFGHWQFVPEFSADLDAKLLLGALAFAGAGGTLNLGQSNYVKEKGYGMGKYIGRITSPITGKPEPVSEFGYHFPHTPENLARWRLWWRRASAEHFVSFFLTCVVCLTLLTLISYSIFYQPDGSLVPEGAQYGKDLAFLYGERTEIEQVLGGGAATAFLLMGVAVLLTTELGILDVTSRISTDIVKVNWLRSSTRWNESRLYYLFLWGTIVIGTVILLLGDQQVERSLVLFKFASALNGGVMFIYSMTLLYLNRRLLPGDIRITPLRMAVMVWSILFFGSFTIWALWTTIAELLA